MAPPSWKDSISRGIESCVTLLGSVTNNIEKLDLEWRVIKNFNDNMGGSGNLGLALVERKKDGKIAMRKKVKMELNSKRLPELIQESLVIFSHLDHPNICRWIAGYTEKTQSRLYTEVCDLGDLREFRLRDSQGRERGTPRHFPGAFYWHIVRSLLKAFCYLTYGYHDLDQVLNSDDEKPGWDPILHEDINTMNVFLKSSETGEYPVIKLADFDSCKTRSIFYRECHPEDDPVEQWTKAMDDQVSQVISIILNELLSHEDAIQPEIEPLRKVIRSCCTRTKEAGRQVVSCRELARRFVEAERAQKLTYKLISAKHLEPYELFKGYLPDKKRKREEEDEKSAKRRSGGDQERDWKQVEKSAKRRSRGYEDRDWEQMEEDKEPSEPEIVEALESKPTRRPIKRARRRKS